MKALYTNEKEIQSQTIAGNDLKTYNYDSRYQALKEGYKFVHLFKTVINEQDESIIEYYSTMKL